MFFCGSSKESGSDLNEAKSAPKEAPKRKRGRPKKGSIMNDVLDQAKLEHLKKDMDQSFLFIDQNQIKFLKYGDMIRRPKRRGRFKKSKWSCPKKKLVQVNEPALDQLCPAISSLEENYHSCQSRSMEVASDIITAKVDTVQPVSTVKDGVFTKEGELGNTFNKELINTSHEEEHTESSNGDVKVSDIRPSTRVLRCSVRLKRLKKDDIQQHLSSGTDDEAPVDETLKTDPLLENLGKFLRYKGSSTRGNFFKAYDYGDIASPWCFEFSDDSCDEDYLSKKEVFNKKKSNDDSDWIPSEKSTKRKRGKYFPVHNNVKTVKSNKKKKASTTLSNSFIDNSGTSVDNSFPSIGFYSPYLSGEFGLLTTPYKNVDSVQTSACVSTDFILNSDKNRLLKKRAPGMMSETKVIQSSTVSMLKRKHSELQVSGTSTYPSKNTIEVIDLCYDSSPEDESAKILSCDSPMKTLTSDCPIKDDVPFLTNSAANTLPNDTSKEHSYSQMRGDSKRTNSHARKQSIRKIQNTLQSILKQNTRPKRKVSQACGVTSNPSTSVGSDFQTVLQKQDSQLLTEVPVGKSSIVPQDEIIQTSNRDLNESAKIDNALKNSSHNSKLMPGLFGVEPPFKTEVGQPKQATEMTGSPVQHVSFEKLNSIPNSSISRSEQNIEEAHAFDVSHIVHCNKISGNLNDENVSAENCCTYCKNFVELDAITILAAADFVDDPKAYIECEIESNKALYEELKVGQPQDGGVDLKLVRVEHKNRFLKYGRDYLSNFGSFIAITKHLLK